MTRLSARLWFRMLIDTHVALWFSGGTELTARARERITDARNSEGVYFSAVSVWEVGNLIRKGRTGLDRPLVQWVSTMLGLGGFRAVGLTIEIALEAAALPPPFHDDPADRFLVATARHLGVPIMTRDQSILDYSKTGAVQAITC